MKRFAFKMKLKPGCEKEYEQRHAAIWPELVDMIHQQGVSNYSIYWDKETNLLFAYQECAGEGSSQDTSAVDPITQKWWDMMADIMDAFDQTDVLCKAANIYMCARNMGFEPDGIQQPK
jgi:L-rhamnose mutarotase